VDVAAAQRVVAAKQAITRWRNVTLGLTIAGALLVTVGAQHGQQDDGHDKEQDQMCMHGRSAFTEEDNRSEINNPVPSGASSNPRGQHTTTALEHSASTA
jgi:hypothetical protein